MPPFGNPYGLDVYVDRSLTADEEIFFEAGAYDTAVKMKYQDFADFVRPKIEEFHQPASKLASQPETCSSDIGASREPPALRTE